MKKDSENFTWVRVKKSRDNKGNPSCWGDGGRCKFLIYGMDCQDYCAFLNRPFSPASHDLTPLEGCPVWKNKEED